VAGPWEAGPLGVEATGAKAAGPSKVEVACGKADSLLNVEVACGKVDGPSKVGAKVVVGELGGVMSLTQRKYIRAPGGSASHCDLKT
jgi:hypothetical protein